MFVVRKIDRAKWGVGPDLGNESISADAVTINLKTRSNRMSFWLCPSEEESVKIEVILALASEFEDLNKVDIALIEKAPIEESGISFKEVSGTTPVLDLKDLHLDAVDLNLDKINILANLVADAVRNKDKWFRYTTRGVLEIIVQAINHDRISIDELKEKMRSKVEKAIED